MMLQRTTVLAAFAAGVIGLTALSGTAQPEKKAAPEDQAKAKKALQDVQDFIGLWNLEGTQKVGGRTEAWKEQLRWGWKFMDGDAWFVADFAEGKGKYYTAGELKYDVAKKKYVLTLTPAEKGATPQTFEGTFARGALKVEHKDAKTNDVTRITMNTVAEGSRFTMKVDKQDKGKGLYSAVFAMNGSKDGLVVGAAKKPECIVSGGSANIAVSYNGNTYYVCCSGCRDEFNANPAKYVKGK